MLVKRIISNDRSNQTNLRLIRILLPLCKYLVRPRVQKLDCKTYSNAFSAIDYGIIVRYM